MQPTPAGKRDQDTSLPSQGRRGGGAAGTGPGGNLKQGVQLGGHQGSGLLGLTGLPLRRSLVQAKESLEARGDPFGRQMAHTNVR